MTAETAATELTDAEAVLRAHSFRSARRDVNSCCDEHIACRCGWQCDGSGRHDEDPGHEDHETHVAQALLAARTKPAPSGDEREAVTTPAAFSCRLCGYPWHATGDHVRSVNGGHPMACAALSHDDEDSCSCGLYDVSPAPSGADGVRAEVEALADEAKKRKAAWPSHPHWAAWDAYEADLRDLLALSPSAGPDEAGERDE